MNKKIVILVMGLVLLGFTNATAQRGKKQVNPQSKQLKYSTTV